jgi:hypothetical protein
MLHRQKRKTTKASKSNLTNTDEQEVWGKRLLHNSRQLRVRNLEKTNEDQTLIQIKPFPQTVMQFIATNKLITLAPILLRLSMRKAARTAKI